MKRNAVRLILATTFSFATAAKADNITTSTTWARRCSATLSPASIPMTQPTNTRWSGLDWAGLGWHHHLDVRHLGWQVHDPLPRRPGRSTTSRSCSSRVLDQFAGRDRHQDQLGNINGSLRGQYRVLGGTMGGSLCNNAPGLMNGLWFPDNPPAGYSAHHNGKYDAPDCATPGPEHLVGPHQDNVPLVHIAIRSPKRPASTRGGALRASVARG